MAAVPSTGRADHVDRVAAPEADATRALYERYANQIFGYCLHQLGSREEAEDAVQSTFLNAFRGLKRGVVPELESAWLFKIAHNVCLSRRRSSWRRGRIESPADFDLVEELAAAPARRADELMGLQDVLETMPENQRRAILLREWQGLSYREIADELELSQAAVETLIFRARRSLASGLEQPPEPARKRARRHAGDLGNLLAGIKSMLLGSAAAVKVAATVAVISATTVVAAAPVQHPHHHATPSAPQSSSPGSAGAGASAIVSSPSAAFQGAPGAVSQQRHRVANGAHVFSAGAPFGPRGVVDGTAAVDTPFASPPSTTQSAGDTPAAQQPAPSQSPSQSAPSAPAPPASAPGNSSSTVSSQVQTSQDQTPASSGAGAGGGQTSTGQTTVQSQPLSQTASPGLSQTSGQDQSSGTGSSQSTSPSSSSSSQSSSSSSPSTPTTPTSAPRIPVTTVLPPPASGSGSSGAGSAGTSASGSAAGSSSSSGSSQSNLTVVGGPLSQRAPAAGSATTPGAPSSGTNSSGTTSGSATSTGASQTSTASTSPPASSTTTTPTTPSATVIGKPKIGGPTGVPKTGSP